MAIGPGRYDEECTMVRERVGLGAGGGAVMVIVLGGDRGHGFSVQAAAGPMLLLPELLESVAREIRESVQ